MYWCDTTYNAVVAIHYLTENYWSTLGSMGKSWQLCISKILWNTSFRIPKINCNKYQFPKVVSFTNCTMCAKYTFVRLAYALAVM